MTLKKMFDKEFIIPATISAIVILIFGALMGGLVSRFSGGAINWKTVALNGLLGMFLGFYVGWFRTAQCNKLEHMVVWLAFMWGISVATTGYVGSMLFGAALGLVMLAENGDFVLVFFGLGIGYVAFAIFKLPIAELSSALGNPHPAILGLVWGVITAAAMSLMVVFRNQLIILAVIIVFIGWLTMDVYTDVMFFRCIAS